MSRVEWSGGWAELTDRLTHARRMKIIRSFKDTDQPAGRLDVMVAIAAAHVTAWSEGEVDRVTGPPVEAFDPLPSDAVDALTAAAAEIWTDRADPNATGAPSADGPKELTPEPMTPTSPTPSSS